ncbi:MAG: hypothetical protein HZB19_11140 [Chloroflexi bacterium]|nr:hypothetical protein [Chloroflexota bacterium]
MTTKFDPQKPFDNAQGRHHRRSIRLPGYDYSQAGAYFVTIVAYQRECLFGEIVDGEMVLNHAGKSFIGNGLTFRNVTDLLNWVRMLSCQIIFMEV